MQNESTDSREIEINLGDLFQNLIKWLWTIILATGVCAVIFLLISMFYLQPIYESTTKIFVLNTKQQAEKSVTYSDVQTALSLTSDYEQLIKSRTVLEKVISELKMNCSVGTLSDNVTVTSPTDTRILEITVKDTNAVQAKKIADKVREISATQIEEIMNIEAVNLIDEANLPSSPSSPNIKKNTLFGALFGFVLSCGIIILLYVLNDSISTPEDIEKYLQLSVLGIIPLEKDKTVKSNRKRIQKK